MSWQRLRRLASPAIRALFAIWLVSATTLPLAIVWFSAPAALADEPDEAARRREFLTNSIPRNRRLRETLVSIDQLEKLGRSAEAIKTVQWILDQPFDVFVFNAKKQTASVKGLAEAKLRAFPPEWRKQYERIYGLEARQLLEDAQLRNEDRLAVEILRRFGTTTAAEDAAIWLALRWLDRGEIESALSILIPGELSEAQFDDLSSRRLAAAQLAAVISGREDLAQRILKELSDRSDSTAAAVTQKPPAQPVRGPGSLRRSERLDVSGETGRSAWPRDVVPVVRPRWTASLVGPRNRPQLQPVFDAWRSHHRSLNLAPVAPNLPLVVRNQVIVRNDEGVCGFDLESGRPLWTFSCETTLSGWVEESVRQRRADSAGGQQLPAEMLQWWCSNNTQLGYLSSDGIRVYATDSLIHMASRQLGRQDAFQPRPVDSDRRDESNRLLALELPQVVEGKAVPAPRLLWSSGRSLHAGREAERAYFFFGPPVISAGRLLSIVEIERELRLVSLQAETGTVLWEQPLAAVDRAAVHDGERAFAACVPVLAGGMVLCPTQAGVLAAVDSATGRLRWSYFDGDLPPEQAGRRGSVLISRGRPGFAASTVVRGDRVVHLPIHSSSLHCVELETGRFLWAVPRQQACSIAAVTSDTIVLLESQGCRAVRLSDGKETWKQSLPPVTGTGLVLETAVVIPLDQGRFALLDIATGRKLSWQPPRTGVALGNLTVCGDVVLSSSADGLAVFPQAGLIRRTLQTEATTASAVEQALMSVDLSLASGEAEQAERSLETALATSISDPMQAELQHLLRELLYHQLETTAENSGVILARLKRLAADPAEQGRYIARQARWAIERKDVVQLRTAMRELARLPTDVVFPSADGAEWMQSGTACCRQMLAEAEADFPEFVREFRQELLDALFAGGSQHAPPEAWRFALPVCDDDLQAGAVRDRLARRLRGEGRKHVAEMLWLRNLRGDDAQLAADAAAGLAGLWSAAGWPRDSARLLTELEGKWSDVRLRSGQTGGQFVASLGDRDDARQWQARMVLPRGPIRSASIQASAVLELPDVRHLVPKKESRLQLDNADRFADAEFSRRLMPSEPLSADVLVYLSPKQSILSVVDKSTSQTIRHWGIPLPCSHPAVGGNAFQGHFLPIGAPGEFRGYSLLELAEDAPLWSLQPVDLDRQRAAPIIGPGGPSFATFQTQNGIYVCSTWDGSILWQRTDLEPHGGLYADPASGVAGDERCLVVFGADRASYSVYDTQTGKRLRNGRIELEQPQTRRAFGRKILRISREKGQWLARVWDPLFDKWELREPLGEKNYTMQSIGPAEIAWLTPDGTIRGYDLQRSQPTMDVRFPDGELEMMNNLRFIQDGSRFYVNLQRNMQSVHPRDYNFPMDKTLVPCVHIKDDLYGIDRLGGRVLWKKSLPHRTLLKLDPPGLPFLVLLSLVRDRSDGNVQSMLVEVRDAETGDLIGLPEHLPLDRIVHADYDAVEQNLRLRGEKSGVQIRVTTSRARQD